MHIIFESVLVLFTLYYQNQSMLDKTAAWQSWLIFLRQCILLIISISIICY